MTPINLALAFKSALNLIKIHHKETISIALTFYILNSLMTIPIYPYLTKLSEIEDPNLLFDYFVQTFSYNQNIAYLLVFIVLSSLISLMLRIYYIKFSLVSFEGRLHDSTLHTLKLSFFLIPIIFVANFMYLLVSFVGLLLLIIPGLIFMLSFYFYEYFIISGQASFFEAFSKSQLITRGYKLQLMGIIVFFAIISFSISSLIEAIFGNLMITSFSISSLLNSITSLFYMVMMSHIFTQLKNIKRIETDKDTNSLIE
jgi:hypothetical protein